MSISLSRKLQSLRGCWLQKPAKERELSNLLVTVNSPCSKSLRGLNRCKRSLLIEEQLETSEENFEAIKTLLNRITLACFGKPAPLSAFELSMNFLFC